MIRRRRKASQSDDEEQHEEPTLSEEEHSSEEYSDEEEELDDDEQDDDDIDEDDDEQQPVERQRQVPTPSAPSRHNRKQGAIPNRKYTEPRTEFRAKSKSKVSTTSPPPSTTTTEEVEESSSSSDQHKKEKDPAVVPTTGRFFMHDDRTSGSRGGPRPFRQNSKGVWNQDESAWVHDKFQSLQIDDRRGPKKTFYRKKSYNKDNGQLDQQQYSKRNGTAHTVQQYRPKKQDNASVTEEYKPKQDTFTNKQYQRKVSYQPKKQVKEEPVVEHKTSQPHKRYSQRGAHKVDETQPDTNGPSPIVHSTDKHVQRNASPTLPTGYTQEPRNDIPAEYSGQYTGGYMQYPYMQPNYPYHQYPYGAYVSPYSVVPDQGIQYYPPMGTYGALNDNQTRYSRKYQKPLQNTGTIFTPNGQHAQLPSDQTQPQLAPRRSHAIPIVDPEENAKSVSTTTST